MNTAGMQPKAQEAPEQDEYIEEIDVQEAGVSGGGKASPPPSPTGHN